MTGEGSGAPGGPLAGLRVLDLTRGTAGAIAGLLLADYGAEVLRIEPPGGDPLWDELPGYPVWHRGKTVVEMDLRSPRARAAVLARLPVADVLLESFAPGTMESFALSYPEVAPGAPRLIYVSISGYGQDGPARDRPGFDALVQARAGVQWYQGAAAGRPTFCAFPWPSFGAGLLAVIGLLAALERRRHTGLGERVDTSLLDGVLAQSTMFVLAAERPSPGMRGAARLSGIAPTMAIYACGDGRSLHIQTGARGALDRLFELTGLKREDFIGPSTGRHFSGDPEGAARFRTALTAAFASRPRDAWIAALQGADVPSAPCLEPGEALGHPQTRAIGMAVELNDPVLGSVTQIGLPMRFAETPGAVRAAAVRRGMAANPEAALRHSGWPTADEAGPVDSGAADEEASAAPAIAAGTRPDDRSADARARAPLAGLRVLDFGMFAAGPYAAMLFADLGADVLKIEPLEGDTMRPMERNFPGLHRGKRGLALDLKSPAALAVVDRLVRTADVLIHNLRPGVPERLGIGWERLSAQNPHLIYCHNTAYGSLGPMARLGGFDQMYQAFCGMEVLQGGEGNPPQQVAGAPLDCGNALLSAAAVLMALHRRAATGRGQHVECPQLAAGLFAMSDFYLTTDGVSHPDRLDREQTGYRPTYRLYATADDWLFVCCADEPARERFRALAGDDPVARLAAEPAAAWIERLASAGIDCERAVAALGDAMLDDPELFASGRVVATEHPLLGRVRQLGGFVRFGGRSCSAERAVPLLGEHTREVLAEIGFSSEEIARLHADGVVRSAG